MYDLKVSFKNILFVTEPGFWFFHMITRGRHYSRQLERIYILVRVWAHYQNASTCRKALRLQENAESMLYKLWALPIRSIHRQCPNHLFAPKLYLTSWLLTRWTLVWAGSALLLNTSSQHLLSAKGHVFLGEHQVLGFLKLCFSSAHLKCALFPSLAPEHLSQTGFLYVLQILLIIITLNTLSRSQALLHEFGFNIFFILYTFWTYFSNI